MTRRKDPQPDAEAGVAEPAEIHSDPSEPVGQTEPEPDPSRPEPEPGPDAAPPQLPRRSGFVGPILGGALAAIGGFALSHFDVLGLAAPDNSAELSALASQVAEAGAQQSEALDRTAGEIAVLDQRLAKLESAPSPEPPDLTRLDTLDQRLAAIEAMPADGSATNTALAAKVAELDRRLSEMPATEPASEVREQLDAALARLEAAETTAETRAAEAEAAVAASRRALALDSLSAAVADGRPFTAELQALADPALSTALDALAATGVPTLAALQADFPDAARAALQIARQLSAEDGWSDRLVDFLASQTGARSLTPQEGTTPDAILSRAEFALTEARVADALAELDALDPTAKVPLEGWITAAGAHVVAVTALQTARGE